MWTWTAIDADSKLCLSFYVGDRTAGSAHEFMQEVASRIKHRVQLWTDGLKQYLDAVEDAFLGNVAYGQLVKIYDDARQGDATALRVASAAYPRLFRAARTRSTSARLAWSEAISG